MRGRGAAGAAAVAALAGFATFACRPSPRLLWFEGRAVHWQGNRGLILTADGELFAVRRGLALSPVDIKAGERTLLDAAPGIDGTVWLADAEGSLLTLNKDGSLRLVGRAPFDRAAIAPGEGGLWAARSGREFSYRPEDDRAPLAVRLDSGLNVAVRAGSVRVPDNPFMTQLANASQLAPLSDGGVIVAPFVRDEVMRYSADGKLLWRTERHLAQATPNPTMTTKQQGAGPPQLVVDYAPVNLGVTLSGDGTIFVLSTVAARTDSSRVDELDPATGAVRRTWRFGTAQPTLAVNDNDVVTEAGVQPAGQAARATFASFTLPAPMGDTLRLADLAGRVTLVNFWASWCGPCRDEFPALDSLAGTFDTGRVAFVALSDDVSRGGALRFLAQHPVHHLRIGFGGGNLKDRYHYVGLPTTTLLGMDGRVRGRWIGFAGPTQIAAIRDSIGRLLATAMPMPHHH